jgi:hypothetical protein
MSAGVLIDAFLVRRLLIHPEVELEGWWPWQKPLDRPARANAG